MAFNASFARGLWLRVAALAAALAALAAVAVLAQAPAAAIIAGLAAIGAGVSLLRFVRRTNVELTRFIDALRYADLTQSFTLDRTGAGFEELGIALTGALDRLRSNRSAAEEDARFLRALVDHVPVALVAIDGRGRTELLNNAARRMLGPQAVANLAALARFGPQLVTDLTEARPGERRLTHFAQEGVRQSLALSVAQITTSTGTRRVVSLQNIQNELDATELAVWRDLVRVLTHEIMNSITPVASLAKTAAALLAGGDGPVNLADARDAVDTLARRSDGLMHFVQSYRQLTKVPPPARSTTPLLPLFDRMARLFRTDWPEVRLTNVVTPDGLEVFADPELIEQVVLNILRNAAQAAVANQAGGGSVPAVHLAAQLNGRGHVTIQVTDSGSGVPADIKDSVFLPFFTTKRDGTGVGLSLARQIMLAHGGAISVENAPPGTSGLGGATFTLTF